MAPPCLLSVFLILALSATSIAQITPQVEAPIVDLGYVKYSGYQNATIGINYYRGIHYAKAPVGELRWRKPIPIDSVTSYSSRVVNASTIAPACYQSQPLWGYSAAALAYGSPYGQSEDCLVLDILVPSKPVSKKLPVMVQIHGGGYTLGNAQLFPGDAMVNQSDGNMLYVSIQYRLGIFGFLAGKEIANDGSLNAGLLDQRAALEWIQRHIGAFGGDPSRVTIWGDSAGGGSVSLQLIANGGTGTPPFAGAIAGYPWWQPLLNSTTQETQYNTALQLSKCADLRCLRSLSGEALANVGQGDMNVSSSSPGLGYGTFWFGPVVDGTFVRNLPDQEYKLGNFFKVPLIVDREAYEGVYFTNPALMNAMQETIDAQFLFPFAGPSFFTRLYQLYPASDFNSTFFQRQKWFGDFIIICPTYQMATAMTDRSPNRTSVFKLIAAIGTEIHGSLLPFMASTEPGFPTAPNSTLAQILTSYWISFAVTGDPNPLRKSDAPFWTSYFSGGDVAAVGVEGEAEGFGVLSVNYTEIGTIQDVDASAQCDFFSGQGWVVRN
ncbi:alpha/beta-hydrolase [Lepidopterella palustris CBS 459.81]|uniref:Carboxylic ester hydrolase n=1 Tax=Lepidopterella palustris CBS 459.81 TaxID=1314670 RepID=A0A8E2J939_9PEZI|nr:alpha/beta-hydrolase [Lepidopterella palustris CBS 459.81]